MACFLVPADSGSGDRRSRSALLRHPPFIRRLDPHSRLNAGSAEGRLRR